LAAAKVILRQRSRVCFLLQRHRQVEAQRELGAHWLLFPGGEVYGGTEDARFGVQVAGNGNGDALGQSQVLGLCQGQQPVGLYHNQLQHSCKVGLRRYGSGKALVNRSGWAAVNNQQTLAIQVNPEDIGGADEGFIFAQHMKRL